jgi:very-short-patch-repair endonuclease
MRSRRLALTGPSAAALYELDGFREITWPDLWCAPQNARQGQRTIRMRDWQSPTLVGDVLAAPIDVVLRHICAVPSDLEGLQDGLSPTDRLELAVEHALRLGAEIRPARGGSMPGDAALRAVVELRGAEPPTESYAETRAVQLLRCFGVTPWRQLPILRNGRIAFRADLMLPFAHTRRPDVVTPSHGLLLEVDSREFHESQFERDHRRGSTYDELGFHWLSITPNQVEFEPKFVHRAVAGAFARAGFDLNRTTQSTSSHNLGRIGTRDNLLAGVVRRSS